MNLTVTVLCRVGNKPCVVLAKEYIFKRGTNRGGLSFVSGIVGVLLC